MISPWVNGYSVSTLDSVKDRGLAYGDGLFETIYVKSGRIPLLKLHMERLQVGCHRLNIPMDISLIQREILSYSQQIDKGILKVIITRGDSSHGYAIPTKSYPRRILQYIEPSLYPKINASEGVILFNCATRLSEQTKLAGIKHLNRLEQVIARSEWNSSVYSEGLMRDTTGRVIECIFSNLFFVKSGKLITANLHSSGVDGVMRRALLESSKKNKISFKIIDIRLEDILNADELFICNSIYGVWPVRELCNRNWKKGEMTRIFQDIAFELLES